MFLRKHPEIFEIQKLGDLEYTIILKPTNLREFLEENFDDKQDALFKNEVKQYNSENYSKKKQIDRYHKNYDEEAEEFEEIKDSQLQDADRYETKSESTDQEEIISEHDNEVNDEVFEDRDFVEQADPAGVETEIESFQTPEEIEPQPEEIVSSLTSNPPVSDQAEGSTINSAAALLRLLKEDSSAESTKTEENMEISAKDSLGKIPFS